MRRREIFPIDRSEGMTLPEHFHLSGDYVSYRPKGEVTFAQLIDLCSSAVSFARLYDIKCLLADTTQLTGFGPPSTLERFEFVCRCALAANGAVKLAVLAKPEMIDRDGFGIAVARNRGLVAGIFASEGDALQWLRNPNSA